MMVDVPAAARRMRTKKPTKHPQYHDRQHRIWKLVRGARGFFLVASFLATFLGVYLSLSSVQLLVSQTNPEEGSRSNQDRLESLMFSPLIKDDHHVLKHRQASSIRPSSSSPSSSLWDTCQEELIPVVSMLQHEWYRQKAPLLHNIIFMPATQEDKFIFILPRNIPNREAWVIHGNWTCPYYEDGSGSSSVSAPTHGWEANNNTMVRIYNAIVIELTCPAVEWKNEGKTSTSKDYILTVVKGPDGTFSDGTTLSPNASGIPPAPAAVMHYDISAWKKAMARSCHVQPQQNQQSTIRRNDDDRWSYGIPDRSTNLVACTMLHGFRWEFRQWLEYHRLMGVQHFLIYLHEPTQWINHNNVTSRSRAQSLDRRSFSSILREDLPEASDITYIPWHYELPRKEESGKNIQIAYQAAQNHDCRLRAVVRNVTWLSFHDVDEYFVVVGDNDTSATQRGHTDKGSMNDHGGKYSQMKRTSISHNSRRRTLLSLLREHESDPYLAAIQTPSWFFNTAGEREMHSNETATKTRKRPRPVGSYSPTLLVDNVWKASQPHRPPGGGREKLIIRPDRVQYFTCHKILLTTGNQFVTKSDGHRLQLFHYKRMYLGQVFIDHDNDNQVLLPNSTRGDIVLDSSLRTSYASLLSERLKGTMEVGKRTWTIKKLGRSITRPIMKMWRGSDSVLS